MGNNFNLEGQNAPGQKSTDIAGNVSANYKITKDGRYIVRVYRRDQFVVVEGQVIETGIGFTITYEYNRFKELFRRRSPEERRLRKEYREKQKEEKKEKKEADRKADSTAKPVPTPEEIQKTSH